jgi:hypothetical protein
VVSPSLRAPQRQQTARRAARRALLRATYRDLAGLDCGCGARQPLGGHELGVQIGGALLVLERAVAKSAAGGERGVIHSSLVCRHVRPALRLGCVNLDVALVEGRHAHVHVRDPVVAPLLLVHAGQRICDVIDRRHSALRVLAAQEVGRQAERSPAVRHHDSGQHAASEGERRMRSTPKQRQRGDGGVHGAEARAGAGHAQRLAHARTRQGETPVRGARTALTRRRICS